MDQALHPHQFHKDLFQWRMDKKRFNISSHWEELGADFNNIFFKEIPIKDLMVITKVFNPNGKFKLLVEREARVGENQSIIQALEEILNQKEHTMIPSGSKGVNQPDFPVALTHPRTSRSVAKSHHSS
ncbi:hypothetical protein O181_117461 [Austropuccinia psidii MF-1]|uniref:Uncharacterized protein n=1 Tax=Austropuccinia psidii MF-1 TaxID=1389203 RepID=A0A9Q3PXY7_9BASI|nr:hypothetical protein [Austropuccinia psidii MF-1]